MQSPGTRNNRQDLRETSSDPHEHNPQPQQFAEFFHREFSSVIAFLLRQGANYEDAQDAAQEAFLDAFRNWDNLLEPAGWVRVVATRKFYRRQAIASRDVPTPTFPGDLISSSQDAIEQGLEGRRVLDLLRSLSPLQRTVMAFYIDGFKSSEIAAVLGISESTARVHLHRARQQLKGRLAAHDTDDGQDTTHDRRGAVQ